MRHVQGALAAVLAAARELLRRGLVEGTSGNVSARREDGSIVITPSSVDYERMELEDLVVLGRDGTVLSAKKGRDPSSERLLDLACYEAFDDVGSVIHSHPVHATMFAVAREAIPACIDEMPVFVGGDVRCSEYAASGSAGAGKSAVAAALHITALSSAAPRSCGALARSAGLIRCPTTLSPASPPCMATSARTRLRLRPNSVH